MPYTVTSARGIQNVAFGTRGARALVFPGRIVLILGSHADCDEVIRAACAAKADMPVNLWPSLYGPALAALNPREPDPPAGPDEPHAHQPVSYVAFDRPTLAGDPGGAA